MTQKSIPFATALCLVLFSSSCYNAHNAENIVGKWKGTYSETCGAAARNSSVEIEFGADKKFTAKITPPEGKPAITSGSYVVERYQLIFINNRKERDIQHIDKLTEDQFNGSFTNAGCSGTTTLRKLNN